MRTLKIVILLAAVVSVFAAAGCDRQKVVPDEKVNYGFLQGCVWTPAIVAESRTAIPELATNSRNPIYFTPKKMVVTSFDGKKYSYVKHFDYQADVNSDAITLTSSQANYYFTIHSLSATHMTLFYNGDSQEYVTFIRGDYPDPGQIATTSFPDGWF